MAEAVPVRQPKGRSRSPGARFTEISPPRNSTRDLRQVPHFYRNVRNGRNPGRSVCSVTPARESLPRRKPQERRGRAPIAGGHVGVFALCVEGAAVNTSENVPVRNLRTRGNARAPLGQCNVTLASPARRRGIRELEVNGRGRRVRGDVGIRPTPRLVLFPGY